MEEIVLHKKGSSVSLSYCISNILNNSDKALLFWNSPLEGEDIQIRIHQRKQNASTSRKSALVISLIDLWFDGEMEKRGGRLSWFYFGETLSN